LFSVDFYDETLSVVLVVDPIVVVENSGKVCRACISRGTFRNWSHKEFWVFQCFPVRLARRLFPPFIYQE